MNRLKPAAHCVRLPAAPLIAARGSSARQCCQDIADHYDTSWTRVEGWFTRGLTVDQADELAVMFGFHPSEIWSDWWNIDPDEPA